LGKNYAAILIIWDRMFGTYEPEISETDNSPIYYGIIPQLRSFDPVFANVHHFYHMVAIQTKWQRWWEVPFRHWTPNGAKCPEVSTKSKMNPASKFDPSPPTFRWKAYALGQFALLLMAVGVYLILDDDDAISVFLFPDISIAWGKVIIAATVVLVALWTLSNVSSICTLGVEGTTSTRRSLLCSEGVRHSIVLVVLLITTVLPSASTTNRQNFLTVTGIYFLLNASFFLVLRTELEEEQDLASNIIFADAEAALISEENNENAKAAGVSEWTWYTRKKYQ